LLLDAEAKWEKQPSEKFEIESKKEEKRMEEEEHFGFTSFRVKKSKTKER
jgi:hypothetical protein